MRRCPADRCPHLINPSERYCKTHAREYEQRRGPKQARGYDRTHTHLRARWAPLVDAGTTTCAKCNQLITPGSAWDLGHNDDRTAYTGPEHAHCNRSHAGRRGAQIRNTQHD